MDDYILTPDESTYSLTTGSSSRLVQGLHARCGGGGRYIATYGGVLEAVRRRLEVAKSMRHVVEVVESIRG